MKRKLYFSFSILLVHNTLPTLSVSVIKASKHPDFVRGGRFPPSTCLLKGQMDRSPHLRKKKEKKGMLQQKRVVRGTTCPFSYFIGFCSVAALLTHSLALTRLSPILPLRTPTPLSGPYAPYPSLSYALLLLRGPLAQPRVSYPPYHIVSGYSKL